MSSSQPSERHIILSGEINSDSAKGIIEAIYKINWDDEQKEREYTNFKRKPIKLVISSYGGVVYDGLAIIGAIETSKTPVHTICLGCAHSMALYVFLAGHERLAHRAATFAYHQMSAFVWDKLQKIREDIEEYERLEAMLDEMVISKTSITKEYLDKVKESKQDWYIPADQALKLGIVHKIISGPEEIWEEE